MSTPTQQLAGAELDRAIERALGRDIGERAEHEWTWGDRPWGHECRRCGVQYSQAALLPCVVPPRPFSTDMAAAWALLDELEGRGWYASMARVTFVLGSKAELAEVPDVPHWYVRFGGAWGEKHERPKVNARALLLPEAIARAAYRALEGGK